MEYVGDAALWVEAVTGTERSFGVIYDRHRTRVFRAAYRHLDSVTESEDVVAIVFLEAWRLRRKVRIVDGSVLPWLLVLTSNVARNYSRSARRYRKLLERLPPGAAHPDDGELAGEALDSQARRRRMAAAISRLPTGDRAVVELCLVEELALSDAALALDIPVGTVKSRLHRARRRLQSDLSELVAEMLGDSTLERSQR